MNCTLHLEKETTEVNGIHLNNTMKDTLWCLTIPHVLGYKVGQTDGPFEKFIIFSLKLQAEATLNSPISI